MLAQAGKVDLPSTMLKRRPDSLDGRVVEGLVRLDVRTKRLVGRLQPGEIAVIDHPDLDRIAAEALVERKVRAVVNASASATGRYPNLGPLVLATAGVLLIDSVGAEVFDRIREGDVVCLDEGRVLLGDEVVAVGQVVTAVEAQEALDSSKSEIAGALERFAENTLEYMAAEREYLLEAIRLPDVRTEFNGRHVLVVVRGYRYKEDLAALRRGYIGDFRPVLVGVDGGADALLELGLHPDVIIGDMDSVSERALRCGATLVVHAFVGGRAPGAVRLEELGLDYILFEAAGTSEDIAMLLAYERGASLIVAVGTHNSMTEFLEKGRPGMASTFLVRMKVGNILVDAKGVNRLYQGRIRKLDMVMLVASALFALLVVTAVSQPARLFLDNLWNAFQLNR